MADSQRKTANLLNNSNFEQGGWDATAGTIPDKNSNSKRCRYSEFFSISSTIVYYDFKNLNANIIMVDSNGISLGGSGFKTGAGSFALLNNTNKISLIIANTDTTQNITPEEVQSKNISLDYGWQHSLRKLTIATDTFTTLPAVIYADGNNATVGLKGNTVQNGTPTPSSPVDANGVGVRTENLFELTDSSATADAIKTLVDFGEDVTFDTITCSCAFENLEAEFDYGAFLDYLMNDGTHQYVALSGMRNANDDSRIPTNVKVNGNYYNTKQNITFRKIQAYLYTTGYNKFKSGSIKWAFYDSEKRDYEPYGYKIPISSASTTTPVYLGEVETTRRVKKLVLTGEESYDYQSQYSRYVFIVMDAFAEDTRKTQCFCSHYQSVHNGEPIDDVPNNSIYINQQQAGTQFCIKTESITSAADFKTYLAQQYAAGTPVCVWYVLASETTGIVNEPLMKIGDYADTVSGITIPTTTSKDTFDVDTTLKPSEVELTYTGWHDASVKEWDGPDWQ